MLLADGGPSSRARARDSAMEAHEEDEKLIHGLETKPDGVHLLPDGVGGRIPIIRGENASIHDNPFPHGVIRVSVWRESVAHKLHVRVDEVRGVRAEIGVKGKSEFTAKVNWYQPGEEVKDVFESPPALSGPVIVFNAPVALPFQQDDLESLPSKVLQIQLIHKKVTDTVMGQLLLDAKTVPADLPNSRRGIRWFALSTTDSPVLQSGEAGGPEEERVLGSRASSRVASRAGSRRGSFAPGAASPFAGEIPYAIQVNPHNKRQSVLAKGLEETFQEKYEIVDGEPVRRPARAPLKQAVLAVATGEEKGSGPQPDRTAELRIEGATLMSDQTITLPNGSGGKSNILFAADEKAATLADERRLDRGVLRCTLRYVTVEGALHVTISEARDLMAASNKTANPYVKLYVLPTQDKISKLKTKTKAGFNPVWNETFAISLTKEQMQESHLEIGLWENALMARNKEVAALVVPLARVLADCCDVSSAKCVRWYAFEPPGGRVSSRQRSRASHSNDASSRRSSRSEPLRRPASRQASRPPSRPASPHQSRPPSPSRESTPARSPIRDVPLGRAIPEDLVSPDGWLSGENL